MIPTHKISSLPPGQRRRKLALILGSMERSGQFDALYLAGIVRLSLEDPKLTGSSREAITALLDRLTQETGGLYSLESISQASPDTLVRLCNTARHALLSAIGTFPAEWDLIAGGKDSVRSSDERFFFPGLSVYAEDIRSPFNMGSIFRTAEAFGAERLFLSPDSVDPGHPRAERSAMGCTGFLPWDRASLDTLPESYPVFALETGGTPIVEFPFPKKGIVIIGSEELGVSPEALARCDLGRVSIPMYGIKASLNVGVAFGILMENWVSYLSCSASKPF